MVKRILVVDDEPDILLVSTVRLKHLGYEIIAAVDAEQAWGFLQQDTYDLILLDLLLPKMQGDEFCAKIKADDKLKNIPVILFTASVLTPSFSEKIKELGADDCIMKPFEPQELLSKVKRIIG